MEMVLDKSSLPETERHLLENKTMLVLGDEQVNRVYSIYPYQLWSQKYIQYDFTDHRQDDFHANRIVKILAALKVHVNGCCTFTDECGPLATYLCEKLELSGGAGVWGETNARSKSSTHIYLRKDISGVRQFPRTYKYTNRAIKVASEDTLRSAEEIVGFPVVCKPDNGVEMIRTTDEHERLGKKISDVTCENKPYTSVLVNI